MNHSCSQTLRLHLLGFTKPYTKKGRLMGSHFPYPLVLHLNDIEGANCTSVCTSVCTIVIDFAAVSNECSIICHDIHFSIQVSFGCETKLQNMDSHNITGDVHVRGKTDLLRSDKRREGVRL